MKKVLIGLLVVVIVVSLVVNFFLGSIVKSVTEEAGPIVLGVPVKMDKAEFRLMRGHITIKGFTLGNPEGFHTDKAIGIGELTIDLKPASIFSDTIHVKRVYVKAPEINYELGLGTSNIGKIMEGLSKKEEGGKPAEEKKEEPQKKGGKKKVIIDDLLIENGSIHIAAKVTGGVGAPIPLPTIHKTDIGKDEGGASIASVVTGVFHELLGAVTGVATGAAKLVGEGATAVGDAAAGGVKAVGGAIGSLFGGGDEKKK